MMEDLTKKYKSDLLAMVDLAKRVKAQQEGDSWSDSKVAMGAFGHGEFILKLRAWMGGKGGPTIDKMMRLEKYLREVVGEDEYEAFIRRRISPPDDF